MDFFPRMWRSLARKAAALGAVLALGPAGAGSVWAQPLQTATLTLGAPRVVSRFVFDFGLSQPWVDGLTPAQTGLASSGQVGANSGIQSILSLNTAVPARLSYSAGGLTPLGGTPLLQPFLGGTSLAIDLAGMSGAPLQFNNGNSGLAISGIANNVQLQATGDLLFVPGMADYVALAMSGDFQGAGLVLTDTAARSSTIDLRADPFFARTYNGLGALPAELIVRLQHPLALTLNTPSLSLLDAVGAALNSLAPPPALPLAALSMQGLSLPFEGRAALTLDPSDYSGAAAHSAAAAWLTTSGLRSVTLSQSAAWTSPVPEPATGLLLLLGAAAVAPVCARRLAFVTTQTCMERNAA